MVGLQQLSAAQTPRLDLVPELQRRCSNLDGGQQGVLKRLGQLQAGMGDAARQTAQDCANLKREVGSLKVIIQDLVNELQGVRVQQGNLAGTVSGVLDQYRGLDRRVENSTTQGALAVGRVQGVEVEVGQAVENLQKQLVEVRRVAYTPSKIETRPISTPLGPPLSTHYAAGGGPAERGGLIPPDSSHALDPNMVVREAAPKGGPPRRTPLPWPP